MKKLLMLTLASAALMACDPISNTFNLSSCNATEVGAVVGLNGSTAFWIIDDMPDDVKGRVYYTGPNPDLTRFPPGSIVVETDRPISSLEELGGATVTKVHCA